ncbi:MAG: 1-deoxy-D-xylulose-5-phosphate synthase [Chlamydiae bacterium SM23_39]|nr:MAG: 1-deoxy-D-xylulose-5-phosphate synthase [Chlamydiae bacterium SM23_39]
MNKSILKNIKDPKDLKNLSLKDLEYLSSEIRNRIIRVLSNNGGHLSSNLGIVELTIALHKTFDSPNDKFIFDTSHQTYPHKIITGRNEIFDSLRKFKGISGFSNPLESPHDIILSGHSGAALSTSLGIAKARDFYLENFYVITIIGDGSLTCGLTLEGLNNNFEKLKNFIVILNDNKMAISKNVGNIKNILSRIINSPTANKIYLDFQNFLSKIPKCGSLFANQGKKIKESIKNIFSSAIFFEQFGFSYVGPIDGHNIKKLINTFSKLKNIEKPVIIHVITDKGKGLSIDNPPIYHGVSPFNINNGKFYFSSSKNTFPQIFGNFLTYLAEKDPTIFALTPAMLKGSNLIEFKKRFPNRCFDVGIAEGHCITFSGGLSSIKKSKFFKDKKIKVVTVIYSTFLQRAFDNVFHDICIQNNPLILAIDRAGLSGPDGTTHHGIYDIGFLSSMPNMTIVQPRNGDLLKELLLSSFSWNIPISIRYPNIKTEITKTKIEKRKYNKGEILCTGKDILIIAVGHLYKKAFQVNAILKNYNMKATIVDPIFIKPLDKNLFYNLLKKHKYVVTIEEHSITSGFASIFNSFFTKLSLDKTFSFSNKILNLGIPNRFILHGQNEDLLKNIGLDAETIAKKIVKTFELTKDLKKYDYSNFS